MRAIRSDNGIEFKSTHFEAFCSPVGLEHHFFSPYVPQQNDIIARKNQNLIEMARMMLDEHRTPRHLGRSKQHCLPCVEPHLSSSFLEQNLLGVAVWTTTQG
jgi:transposase InsO family protein